MPVRRIGIVGNLPKPYGGVATTCYRQAYQLIAAGNQVTFYDRDRHPEKLCPDGIKKYAVTKTRKLSVALRLISDLPYRWFTDPPFRSFFHRWVNDSLRYHLLTRYPATALRMLLRSLEMIRTFNGQNIDILHAHRALHDAWVAQLLAQYYFKCPFVVTMYTSEFTMEANIPWTQMAIDVCNRASSVECISEYARNCMLKAGVIPKKINVSYLGVEPSHFDAPSHEKIQIVRQRFGIKDDRPVILYIGWMIERKGPQVLLEALPKITHLDWTSIFVGPDRGMKSVLSARADELQVGDRVIVSDAIPDDEILALYSLAHIFVFPTISLDEGFGLVALEAMAHGIPVIASRTGAIPEVVKDQITGLFFTPGDFNELASQLSYLLSKPDIRTQMGVSARDWARKFTWEANCARLMQSYDELIPKYANPI